MTVTPGDPEPVDPGQDPTRGWRPHPGGVSGPAGPVNRAVPVAPPNWLPHRPAPSPTGAPSPLPAPVGPGVARAAARPEPARPPVSGLAGNTVLPASAGQNRPPATDNQRADGQRADGPVTDGQRGSTAVSAAPPGAGARPHAPTLPPELSPRRTPPAQPGRPPVSSDDDILAPSEARVRGRRGRANSGPRRARLVLRRVDPWSVLKFTLVFSICAVIVGVLVIAALFEVVSGLGVFDSVAKFLDTITDAQNGSSTRSDFQAHVIVGGGAVLLAVGALLFTALATLGAFIYNLCASLTGGLEVTLSERG